MQFYDGRKLKQYSSHERIYVLCLILSFCRHLILSFLSFYWQDQAYRVFFHEKNNISQNYGSLFTALKGVLQWRYTKVGVLQNAVLKCNLSAIFQNLRKTAVKSLFLFELQV